MSLHKQPRLLRHHVLTHGRAQPASQQTMLGYCLGPTWNKHQWNFNQNTKLFIHENASKNIVCEMAAILSRWRWVKGKWQCYTQGSCYVQNPMWYINTGKLSIWSNNAGHIYSGWDSCANSMGFKTIMDFSSNLHKYMCVFLSIICSLVCTFPIGDNAAVNMELLLSCTNPSTCEFHSNAIESHNYDATPVKLYDIKSQKKPALKHKCKSIISMK